MSRPNYVTKSLLEYIRNDSDDKKNNSVKEICMLLIFHHRFKWYKANESTHWVTSI